MILHAIMRIIAIRRFPLRWLATLLVLAAPLAAQTPDSLAVTACAAEGCGTAWMHFATPPTADSAWFQAPAPTSPHWRHARFAWTDFWYSYNDTTTRPVLAGRYDAIMSGCGSCYRALDPTLAHTPYALEWTVIHPDPSYHDDTWTAMARWLTAHGYPVESALLHQPGTVADSAHRATADKWSTRRWLVNPADPGAIAFSVDRLRQIRAAGDTGIFYDEYGRGQLAGGGTWSTLEGDSAWYVAATVARFRAERAANPGARIIVNTAGYWFPADSQMIVAAGAAHLEGTDNPRAQSVRGSWTWIEHMRAAGATYLEYVAASAWGDQTSIPPGHELTGFSRIKMAEYESYLLIRDTAGVVVWNADNNWVSDPATHWYRAFEADVGEPTGPRTILASGTDPLGHAYQVYTRAFTSGARVILRVPADYTTPDFSDSARVMVTLPAPGRPLRSDGVIGAGILELTLGAGEGAILLPPS